jgi:hypothetical protein
LSGEKGARSGVSEDGARFRDAGMRHSRIVANHGFTDVPLGGEGLDFSGASPWRTNGNLFVKILPT